jgi:hypothetical protein
MKALFWALALGYRWCQFVHIELMRQLQRLGHDVQLLVVLHPSYSLKEIFVLNLASEFGASPSRSASPD